MSQRNPLFPPGQSFQIGQHATSVSKTANILYLAVQYHLNGNTTVPDGYGDGSGIYSFAPGIDKFIQDRVNQAAFPTDFTPIQNGLPVINQPVWVVFAIDPHGSESLSVTAGAVVTNDGTAGSPTTPHYYNLTYAFETGEIVPSPPANIPSSKCYLAYFEAPYTNFATGNIDRFNIFLKGITYPIDPEIQNMGHPPPPKSHIG